MIPSLLNRADYPTLSNCVYLNQASLGLIGQPAVTAMQVFIEQVARNGNSNMTDREEVAFLESLQKRAARMLNANESQLAITAGASELLGQLPFLIQTHSRKTILAVASDFPAITRPWHRLAALGDCSVHLVDDIPGQDLTDNLIVALDQHVAIVAVGHVQYATGTVVDVSRLRDAASHAGSRLIVDATQAVGAIPVDTGSWNADAVVCSGYKWLGGHGGVALGVMPPPPPPACWSKCRRCLAGWGPEPFDFDATSVRFVDDARRYTKSTLSYVSVAGLTVALDQLLALGTNQIEEHARMLADILIDGVARHGWQPFRPLDDPAASTHIISLARPGNDTQSAIETLRKHNVLCGTRAGCLRVSIAPYNDESDVMAFLRAISEVPAS